MKKLLLTIVLLISLTPITSYAEDLDYGYFGVTQANKKSLILWAEYPYNRHQFKSVQIDSDGQFVLRQFGKKGDLISQKLYEKKQTLSFTAEQVHGIQIQLVTNKGTYARLENATTTNPRSENINFYPEPF